MAKKFIPNTAASGVETPFDNIVGLQTVQGGGLTQGNFEFSTGLSEKVNRTFNIGVFQDPISLEDLNIDSVNEARELLAKEFRVYPNYDLSQVTNFTIYGSLQKRFEVSVQRILNFFPAGLEIDQLYYDYSTGQTAYNISYDSVDNETTLTIDVSRIKNPFSLDYSINSIINLQNREQEFSPIRDLTNRYRDYALVVSGVSFNIIDFTPSQTLFSGTISLVVTGDAFPGLSQTTTSIVIRPQDYWVEKSFTEDFDEVEKFLLNRLSLPIYTASFNVPKENDNGIISVSTRSVTWDKDGSWNLDIRTQKFELYLENLNEIGVEFDAFKTNLVARFLVTESLLEFDTPDHRVGKVLQIYGRSFDQLKQFIDALAYMNSVNYNPGNDIPSMLLKNLAQTLGWSTNISPITNEGFLSSVYSSTGVTQYEGFSREYTPTELNYQFYRNLILNSAYLFKSKGTRKSIEFTLRLVGAPDALIEFNEHVYLADQRINMRQFNRQFTQITGGTYEDISTQFVPGDVFTIYGVPYTGFASSSEIFIVDQVREDYPVDEFGYPVAPQETENYFFEKGAGWFESTPQHRSPNVVNQSLSVFTGSSPNVQTFLQPFTYGQEYFNRFRNFPYMNLGYRLKYTIDNKKSWQPPVFRVATNAGYEAYYVAPDEKLVLNAKNVELFINPSQGILYNVWNMSKNNNFPIPNTGMTPYYPSFGSFDWTYINPQPNKKTFFEFAQTFINNTINVRDRWYSSDGKTSGYPNLLNIFYNYLLSDQLVGIPNDNFTYQKLIEYVQGIGPYWIRLTQQMIPASTIWNTGVKFENSALQRQKFVYRRQTGCQLIPVELDPCLATGSLFTFDCTTESANCSIYPWIGQTGGVSSFSQILYSVLNNYLTTQGLTLSNCVTSSLVSNWFVDVRIDGNIMFQSQFFTGYGLSQVPSNNQWKSALLLYLSQLINDGYYFFVNGNTVTVYNLACAEDDIPSTLQINVGINIDITCNQ
jgi:hypothetical protein